MDGGGDDNVRPSLSPCIQIEENLKQEEEKNILLIFCSCCFV
jgi:hypothetical protein